MNLELFRIFYEVAECKNVTKASEKLCISQPAVTKHIKNLEDYLGTPLFIRTKKGVILNEAGEKIFLKVKNALTLFDEIPKELSGFNEFEKGTIKIGISTSLTKKFLLNYIKKFHSIHPNIIFNISTDPTKKQIEDLKNGIIDMVICKFPDSIDLELNYECLGKTKYIFVANSNYSELLNRKVNVNELLNYPILLQKSPSNSRNSVDKYFKKNNVKINPTMNIGSSNLLIDFVNIGYGIGYVTKLYAEGELKRKEIFEIDIEPNTECIKYGIITLKNNVRAHYVNEFIKLLKNNN